MREQLRPNGQRAKAAMNLIWIVMAIDVVILVASAADLFLFVEHAHGQEISQTAIDICDMSLTASYGLFAIAYIISIITFIRWFRRAYYNLYTITGVTDYGDGWAAGSWFVPIANLFMPYNIMKELYVKTDRYLSVEDNADYSENRLRTDYIGWWWALWIISGIGGNISIKVIYNLESWDSIIFGKMISLGCLLLSIVLAFVTIIVIRDYADVESQLLEMEQNKKSDILEEEPISI